MMPNYGTPTIALSHGSGSYVWDVEGKKYLDLLGGIAVSALGHANPKISAAVSDQSNRILHTSNLYAHEAALDLAERLVNLFEADSRVFFSQDGATANEAALKLVRKYGFSIKADGSKQTIVAMKNGFHGRTNGALAITGNASKRDPFGPFGYEVRFADFNDIESLESVMADDVAAIFVEPVQGEGGMHIGTTEFLQACQSYAKKHQALLILDEVQSGIGRTGTFFNYTQHQLKPDVVTLAKGLAGGLPLGAVLAIQKIANLFDPGDHGSTFGGNPISVAAASVVVEEVSDAVFLQDVSSKASWFAGEIVAMKLSEIKNVRYAGLWFGIELNSDSAHSVVAKAADAGFLINAVKPNVLRLAPALNISRIELLTFINELEKLVTK
jgi:acetylornithine aminotransferase